jgi:hypothetical protein
MTVLLKSQNVNFDGGAGVVSIGTIQVLRHQRGGWLGKKMAILDNLQYCKSSKSWVGGPKKVKNMMT